MLFLAAAQTVPHYDGDGLPTQQHALDVCSRTLSEEGMRILIIHGFHLEPNGYC